MIFVDGHVHIYDCFDVGFLLDSAWLNFQAAVQSYGRPDSKPSYVLLLAEGKNENWFKSFVDGLGPDGTQITSRWHGTFDSESISITVSNLNAPLEQMHIVPGRQVVTAEKLEVLSLYCKETIKDGMPLDETIRMVRTKGAVPVLPWGVGKWLGKRSKLVEKVLGEQSQNRLFVGDNGGRPVFWPTPTLFAAALEKGIQVLPGTDPLPLKEEASRVGSFGFIADEKLAGSESVVTRLKQQFFIRETRVQSYGSLLSARRFFANQLRLRFSS